MAEIFNWWNQNPAPARNRAGGIVQNPNDMIPGAVQGLGNMLGGAARGVGTALAGAPGDINQMVQPVQSIMPKPIQQGLQALPSMPTTQQLQQSLPMAPTTQEGKAGQWLGANVLSNLVPGGAAREGVVATKGVEAVIPKVSRASEEIIEHNPSKFIPKSPPKDVMAMLTPFDKPEDLFQTIKRGPWESNTIQPDAARRNYTENGLHVLEQKSDSMNRISYKNPENNNTYVKSESPNGRIDENIMLGDHRYDINHLPNGDVNIRHTSGGGLTGKPAKTEGVWKNGETAMGSKPPPNIASIIKDVHPDLNAHKPDVMKMMTPEEYHALPKEGEEYDKALMWSKLQGKPDPKYVNNQGAVITKTSNDIGRNEMNTNNITRPYGLNPHNIEDVSSIPAGLSHEIIDYPGHNLRTENITSPTHHVSIEYKNGKFQRGHIAAGEASDIYPGGGIRDIVNTKSFKTMYPHEVESMKRLGVENPKQLRELLDLAKEEATHKLTGVSAPIKPRKPK